MSGRTLKRLAIPMLLALGGCDGGAEIGGVAEGPAPDPSGWFLASGKAPTKAEFSALAATCQDKGGAMDSCFSSLGLKRAP
jgi:hypothetical protein